jgi:hypothetical protein
MGCSVHFPSTPNRDRDYPVFKHLVHISFMYLLYLFFFFRKCEVGVLGVESTGWGHFVVVKLGKH